MILVHHDYDIISNKSTISYERRPKEFIERVSKQALERHGDVLVALNLGIIGYDLRTDQYVCCDCRWRYLVLCYDCVRLRTLTSLRRHFADMGVMPTGERWTWLPRWLADWPF